MNYLLNHLAPRSSWLTRLICRKYVSLVIHRFYRQNLTSLVEVGCSLHASYIVRILPVPVSLKSLTSHAIVSVLLHLLWSCLLTAHFGGLCSSSFLVCGVGWLDTSSLLDVFGVGSAVAFTCNQIQLTSRLLLALKSLGLNFLQRQVCVF